MDEVYIGRLAVVVVAEVHHEGAGGGTIESYEMVKVK